MQHIILKVKAESKLNVLILFLRYIDFIEIEEEKVDNQKCTKSIEVLFGIWKKRNISLRDIRKKAWKVG